MRTLAAALAVVIGVTLILAVSVWLASESGEVIVLRTYDQAGGPHDTRIWVVEDGGALWVRAGRPANAWYRRLLATPTVDVTRGGTVMAARAVPSRDAAQRDRIHALMAAKYGLADRFISLLRDGSQSVPIRLDPR